MKFELRPATTADREFIWNLRCETMRPILEPVNGWDESTQRSHADESLAGQIVLVDGAPGGVLTVANWGSELHLKWVAVLPSHQRQGLGTALIKRAQDQAAAARLPLTLQVQASNPAVALYHRLGFTDRVRTESRILMRWTGLPPVPRGAP